MTLLKTHSPSQAAHHLQQGGLVAFPTETVYGLGADATNSKAIAAIFAAKQRPQFNPLITHVASKTQAYTLGLFSRTAEQLADHFWPGPLTLVLPKTPLCPVVPLATAGLNTIALRLPAHPLAQELLKIANVPIAAPSANPSGRLSPTKAAHILQAFKDSHILLLEGGDCPLGLESTVLHCPPQGKPMLLRSGALERSEIEKCLQDSLALPEGGSPILSPGQTAAHYRPGQAPPQRPSPLRWRSVPRVWKSTPWEDNPQPEPHRKSPRSRRQSLRDAPRARRTRSSNRDHADPSYRSGRSDQRPPAPRRHIP